MSENRKSFFSSIPGLVTGLAGLLTGIVGLVTVLIQLDVIGGKDADKAPEAGVTTTVAGQGPAPAAGATSTTVAGRFAVEPGSLKLQATEREKTVTVKNTGAATLTVMTPEVGGTDRTAFRADSGCSNVALRPGTSCTLKVTLTPSGPLKTYNAKLLIEAKESPQVAEVPIEATAIL